MARFGYETIGATPIGIDDVIVGSIFPCPGAGTADSITVHLGIAVLSANVKCAIYDAALALVKSTEQRVVNIGARWETFNFVAPKPVLGIGNYWLVAWADNTVEVYHDDGAVNQGCLDNIVYDGWPDPLVPNSYADREFSIYCDYTVAAGWTGKISGVTNPAKIADVPVANIATVKGI